MPPSNNILEPGIVAALCLFALAVYPLQMNSPAKNTVRRPHILP